MSKRKKRRIFWRNQGGEMRAYGDFRDFADVGGGREALRAAGESLATTDPVVAEVLVARRLEALQEKRRNRGVLNVTREDTLKQYAAAHLVKKARSGSVTEQWLAVSQRHLDTAASFFGADRDLATIGVEHVQEFAHWLAEQPNGRGGTLSAGSQRHYLNTLSNLFKRAQSEGIIRGVNPVEALMEKPVAARHEAEWLEVWEAALLLESARTYPEQRGGDAPTTTLAGRLGSALVKWGGAGEFGFRRFQRALQERGARATDEQLGAYLDGKRIPAASFVALAADVLDVDAEWLRNGEGERLARVPAYTYPLLASFLLTGGRESEVNGLELGDVSFKRKVITFRPNEWRRLKTRTSHRSVPLWPQLEEILTEYLDSDERPKDSTLLFPSDRTGGRITDFRKSLDSVAMRAGWAKGEIRTKAFRHTYCAARLQTLDRGHPVSEFTVAREMGHGGFDLVRRVYGHLGTARHRSERVEYRTEHHAEEIPAARLGLLRAI